MKNKLKFINGLGPYKWECSCGLRHRTEKEGKFCTHNDRDYPEEPLEVKALW